MNQGNVGQILLAKLLVVAMSLVLLAGAPLAVWANDGAPCPRAMRLDAGPGGEFDAGWSGLYHDRELIRYRLHVGIDDDCAGSVQPTCGVCSLQQLLPNAGGSNQRCVGDTSLVCTTDADCPPADQPCRYFATPPMPVAGGGVGVCVVNQVSAGVSGTVNIEAGSFVLDMPLKSGIHNGVTSARPCPTCDGDVTPNDGLRNGTCSGGPANGQPCDVNATTVAFGTSSFDCPPSDIALIANLALDSKPIRLTSEPAEATRTLTAASPACSAIGFPGQRCLCGTCSTSATEPCMSDADCILVGGTCGGTHGEPTRPNPCIDVVCTDVGGGEGECQAGPVDTVCSVETFRGCVGDSECRPPGEGGVCPDCLPGGQTCTARLRECYVPWNIGDSVTAPVAPDPLGSTSNTVSPQSGALFCAPATTTAAVNAAAGFPGLVRLSQPATTIEFADEIVVVAAGAGATVTTDTEVDGATPTDPTEFSITTASSLPGSQDVEVVETYSTGSPPPGMALVGQQVEVETPAGTIADPVRMEFVIDASQVGGRAPGEFGIRKNGIAVADCTGAPQAIPNPCVESRTLLGDGDVRVTVLTVTGSTWDLFGTPTALGKGQQQCVVGLNKGLGKVDQAVSKQLAGCLESYADGKPFNPGDPGIDTLEECVIDDPNGKIQGAVGKLGAEYTKRCTAPPSGTLVGSFPAFGATDAATVAAAATAKDRALIHDVFGYDLGASLVTNAVNGAGAACQRAVWKAVTKCQQTKLKEFVACKKNALAGKLGPAPTTEEDLGDLCLGTGASGQPDPKGKIAKACGDPDKGIVKDLAKQCAAQGQDLTALVPPCGNADPLATAQCLDIRVECRVCLALNEADDLERDCDLFDNGAADASCPPPDQFKRVFLSGTIVDGSLYALGCEISCSPACAGGGLAAADALCDCLAGLNFESPLPGTYKAWLSDGTTSAASRLSHASVPYLRVDDVKVADDWTDLTDGTLDAPINVTSTGVPVAGSEHVWTGSNPSGALLGNTCVNWSGTAVWGHYGLSDSTTATWTDSFIETCGATNQLYCVQQ
jgi:hypothetical protein